MRRSTCTPSLCTCTLRFALYYSIVSKRLYILRLTISRATKRLVPTLVLLVASLMAFGIGGNQLFFTTTHEWRDESTMFGTVLTLLRRPMGMNWERMDQNSMIWPMESDEPSPITIIFLMSFTTVVIWIMANLYRAVVIIEYATVVQVYANLPPGDLTPEPWPEIRPLYYLRRLSEKLTRRLPSVIFPEDLLTEEAREKRRAVRIAARRKHEWKEGLDRQRKRRMDVVKQQDSLQKQSKGKGESGQSKKKGGSAVATHVCDSAVTAP